MQKCVRCFFVPVTGRGICGRQDVSPDLIGGTYLKRAEDVPTGTNVLTGTSAPVRANVYIQEFLDMIAPPSSRLKQTILSARTRSAVCGRCGNTPHQPMSRR